MHKTFYVFLPTAKLLGPELEKFDANMLDPPCDKNEGAYRGEDGTAPVIIELV